MVNSPKSDSSDKSHSDTSSDGKRSTPTPKNAFDHAEYLYKKNLIDQDNFGDILLKIKENGNQKEWCNDYVKILSSLCEKSQCYRYMHENANTFYKKLSYRITYSSMLFSGIMSCFSIVSTQLDDKIHPELATLISGIGHLIIAGIIGFQKKMNLPESAEMHEKASQDFDIFCRSIEFQLILPISDRLPVPKIVFDSIDKYNNLVISNPQIPLRILNYFRHFTEKLEIDKPSIVDSFTIMPRHIDINLCNRVINKELNKGFHKDCKNQLKSLYEDNKLKKLKKQGRKYMPNLSPTIKNILAKQKSNTNDYYNDENVVENNDNVNDNDNDNVVNTETQNNLKKNELNLVLDLEKQQHTKYDTYSYNEDGNNEDGNNEDGNNEDGNNEDGNNEYIDNEYTYNDDSKTNCKHITLKIIDKSNP
jgi:hypothetical protein